MEISTQTVIYELEKLVSHTYMKTYTSIIIGDTEKQVRYKQY